MVKTIVATNIHVSLKAHDPPVTSNGFYGIFNTAATSLQSSAIAPLRSKAHLIYKGLDRDLLRTGET